MKYSTVTTDELEKMIHTGRHIVIIDLAAEGDFRQGHIPQAYNLPHGPDVDARFEKNFPNKNTAYIFYADDPQISVDLILELDKRFYANLYSYPPGKQGWIQSGRALQI